MRWLSPRWRKVMRDLWSNKTRTILVLLSIAVGVTAIGMVMGLMPVVGVPLPFISYGGSSIVTMMVCIGILMNVSMRRFLFEQS